MSEVLVNVERGPLVESKHRGSIAIVNAKGDVIVRVGDIDDVIFARSSMKPLQTLPIIETGAADHFQFDDGDLSLCCASHNGERQHTDRAASILSRIGLEVSDLQCGTHPPRFQAAFEEVIKEGKEITPIYNNCSGKHSGMLATAIHMNESIDDYYKVEHPVQQRILSVISELTDVPVNDIQIGIDGCGVPVHGVPLKNLALSFARMADPSELDESRRQSVGRVTKAMMNAPEMVGGTARFCTDFMKHMGGRVFGKVGAEGVYCVGVPEAGLGIAVKIEDGNSRATNAVVMEILDQLDLLQEQEKKDLASYHFPELLNARKEKIGTLRPVFSIRQTVDQ
ncbi:asparaginase [Sporosarcina thermotolerans]|uniref:Asparaginase n=1 Tax=Sporosarcina thermotolerans TaxID=633404 RepID=A0AAW9AC86_9BACL|nr:asparaginase [Sporosarcina thermotolerans]MDW0116703.1 asparaginase [Sporosarcina thermotolerans]